jgi:hypothetical protein
MNKKILFAAIITATVCVSGWNISRSMNETTLSDVALKNVEALAQEPDSGNYIKMVLECFNSHGNVAGKRTACFSGGSARCTSTGC